MKCNLNPVDRTVRVTAGVVLGVVGLLVIRGLLGVVVLLLGAVLVFSGWIGFCHVYKFFRIDTSKKA